MFVFNLHTVKPSGMEPRDFGNPDQHFDPFDLKRLHPGSFPSVNFPPPSLVLPTVDQGTKEVKNKRSNFFCATVKLHLILKVMFYCSPLRSETNKIDYLALKVYTFLMEVVKCTYWNTFINCTRTQTHISVRVSILKMLSTIIS